MAVAVIKHMRGGGDDIVGERELPRAVRVAAAYDAGAGVTLAQVRRIDPTLHREFIERGAPIRAENHHRRQSHRSERRFRRLPSPGL
jgi:hypothetical protein